MIKLKPILLEYPFNDLGGSSSRGREVDLYEAGAWMRKKCKRLRTAEDYLDNPIYRGAWNREDKIHLYTPKSGNRKSANTMNYYTLIIDNSNKWSKYPKRSKSLICGSELKVAQNYGNATFYVIPEDNAKIGICPREDLWSSFIAAKKVLGTGSNLDDLNAIINNLGDLILHVQPEEENVSKLKKQLIDIGNELKKSSNTPIRSAGLGWASEFAAKLIADFSKQNSNLYDYIENMLDPSKNGFKLESAPLTKFYPDREIWTDGEALLVKDARMIEHIFNHRDRESD